MKTKLQPLSITDTERADGFWAAEQLSRIEPFIAVGRQHGFAVTATPAALQLLKEGGHEDAAHLAMNVCPVDSDPWQNCDGQVAAARAMSSHRIRIGFVVSVIGAVVCTVEAIERLASIIGTPPDALDRLTLLVLFGMVAVMTRPSQLSRRVE